VTVAAEATFSTPDFSQEWHNRFSEFLGKKPLARKQWESLVLGGDPMFLTRMASLAMNSPDVLERQRRNLKRLTVKVGPRVRKKILAVASLIKQCNSELTLQNVDTTEFSMLPKLMESYASSLEQLENASAELASGRLPKTGDYICFYLHSYILRATGKPQWEALGTLLEAAYFANRGAEMEIDIESLRKKIAGIKSRDPQGHLRYHFERKSEDHIRSGNGGWPSNRDLEQLIAEFAINPNRTE
jgi:hypothetical protein